MAPTGEIVAKSTTEEDEVISYDCDMALGEYIRNTTFNFAKHRRPEHYKHHRSSGWGRGRRSATDAPSRGASPRTGAVVALRLPSMHNHRLRPTGRHS